jgi:hypothetical protein
MDTLATKFSLKEVYDALEMLPKEVNATYDEAMSRIRRQNGKELAERVLIWVTFAYRPLSLTELQHAVAISSTMPDMDSTSIVPGHSLTSVCAGLVVVDENRGIVRLIRK